jgi:hypothetical protein
MLPLYILAFYFAARVRSDGLQDLDYHLCQKWRLRVIEMPTTAPATFVGIDFKPDDLPIGEAREHCGPERLLRKDREIAGPKRRYHHRAREARAELNCPLWPTIPR